MGYNMNRYAFVDDKLYSQEFASGDIVRRVNIRDYIITPYVGRVIYANYNTGIVMVQWPWGAVVEPPTELIKVGAGNHDFVPPLKLDTSYSTWEKESYGFTTDSVKADEKWRKSIASSIVSEYEHQTKPVYVAACKAYYDSVPEVEAITRIAAEYADEYGFDTVRRTVGNLYGLGRRVALYWKNSQRKYKTSQAERASGKLKCPRCSSRMANRIYRANRAIKQCRSCGFSIHNRDII